MRSEETVEINHFSILIYFLKFFLIGMSFTSSIIVIEELAKIDPSVSVMVDVQALFFTISCLSFFFSSFCSFSFLFFFFDKIISRLPPLFFYKNTLVGIPMRKWGSEKQKQKYLPKLAKDTLGSFALRFNFLFISNSFYIIFVAN